MSSFDDEDAPPPLDSIKQQVQALKRSKNAAAKHTVATDHSFALLDEHLHEHVDKVAETLCQATISAADSKDSNAAHEAKKQPPQAALKRGFFDKQPKKMNRAQRSSSSQAAEEIEEITVIKAKAGRIQQGPSIPAFLRVEPDAQAKQYAQVKAQLTDALKPSEDMMHGIMADPMLLAGFDDPEVMAAVAEIAQNPAAFKKHQNNAKVVAFYKKMAGVTAARLDKLADKTK